MFLSQYKPIAAQWYVPSTELNVKQYGSIMQNGELFCCKCGLSCCSKSVFAEEVEDFNALETISCLVQFVDRLANMGLTVEKNHCLLQHCVLSFHGKVSDA